MEQDPAGSKKMPAMTKLVSSAYKDITLGTSVDLYGTVVILSKEL